MTKTHHPGASSPQRRKRTTTRSRARRLRVLLGNASFVLLGLAVCALLAAVVGAARQVPVSSAASNGAPPAPAGAAQSTSPDGWIAVGSTSPAGLIAAARQSALWQEDSASTGDHAHDFTRLGTPVFVRAVQPTDGTGGVRAPDFYVVPILDGHGAATDAAELELNAAHTAVHVVAIVTYTQPRQTGHIESITASNALTTLQGKAHTHERAGASPQLVYFPADTTTLAMGPNQWTGGGDYPADPMWVIPGADGQSHFIGDNGQVYLGRELPIQR